MASAQSSEELMRVAKGVYTSDRVMYLIRCNDEEMFVMSSYEEALDALDRLADHDAAIYSQQEKYRVLRETLCGGEKIIVSTQTLGALWDGPVKDKVVFDMIKVPCAVICEEEECGEEVDSSEQPTAPSTSAEQPQLASTAAQLPMVPTSSAAAQLSADESTSAAITAASAAIVSATAALAPSAVFPGKTGCEAISKKKKPPFIV